MGFKISDYETFDKRFETMLEHHKPIIVVFKHRLQVQTWVSDGFPTYFCHSKTYVCRLIVYLACHTGAVYDKYVTGMTKVKKLTERGKISIVTVT